MNYATDVLIIIYKVMVIAVIKKQAKYTQWSYQINNYKMYLHLQRP